MTFLLSPEALAPGLAVTWQSVPGRSYVLDRSTSLGVTARFFPMVTNFPAQPGNNTTTFLDTGALSTGAWFYRVRVEE